MSMGCIEMPWARSLEYENNFLKVSTCGTFIIRLGSCTHSLCKDESRILNFQQTEVNTLELFLFYQIYRNLPAEINHCWLNSQVNETRKECKKKKFQEENEGSFFWNWFWKVTLSTHSLLSLSPTLTNGKIIILLVTEAEIMLTLTIISKDCSFM